MRRLAVDFDKLGKVHLRAEGAFNRRQICLVPVARIIFLDMVSCLTELRMRGVAAVQAGEGATQVAAALGVNPRTLFR